MTAVVCTLLLTSATVPCLLYAVLFALGRCRRRPTEPGPPLYLTVLIPAHNEADQLPRTLLSLRDADYPATHLRLLVVADNCTDATAEIARLHGAGCMTRTDVVNHGKGHALAFGLPHAVTGADAVIVLDADCTVNRDFLRRMSDALRHAEVVQAAVLTAKANTPTGYVAAVGSAIDNAVAAGNDAVGGRVPLRGTGMGFRRQLLERLPWSGFGPTEDAEYSATLATHGIRVRFVPDAEARTEPPPDRAAFAVQRKRWSAAFRVGPFALLNSKPLVLAHLLLTAVLVAALSPSAWFLGWLLVLLGITAAMYVTAARPFGWPSVGVLGRTVGVVGRLLMLAVGVGRNQKQQWERTPRR